MSSPGLLVSCFDFSPVAEDEFHDWYDTEHIPERERIPGFMRCRRWLAADGSKVSAATYDLRSVDVLRSPGYLAIGYDNNSPWTRRVGWRCRSLLRVEGELVAGREAPGDADAGALLICGMNVEPALECDFAARFEREHAPAAAAVPGIHDARLFRATAGTRTHVVLYRLQAPEVAHAGGWRTIAEESWAQAMLAAGDHRLRILCRRYARTPDTNAREAA